MRLYLVRHGETDWNAEGIIMGHTDIPLNENGTHQAEALRREIERQGLQFDAVYVSPLGRTLRTAEIITNGNYDLIFDPRLKERACGELEGRPLGELFDNEIDFLNPDLNASDYGVELILDFHQRVIDFLDDLRKNHGPDDAILIVSSSGFMKRLASIITQTPPKEIQNFQNSQIYSYDC